MKIFLDMDGVLSDLVGGICDLVGYHDAWPNGEYDINKVVGVDVWPLIAAAGISFWTEMPKTLEADELMSLMENQDYYICTSPTLDPMCAAGKLQWLRKHYPMVKRRFFITPHKELLAQDHNILIDDSDANITKWHAAGGIGVLFPRPWNSHYMDTDSVNLIQRIVEILS